MCILRAIVVTAVFASVIGPAWAQSEQRIARRPVAPPKITEMWRVSKMTRLPLYDEQTHERIGTLVELFFGADGRVRSVAVDTSTTLKPNERTVIVPFDRLGFSELSVRSAMNQEQDRRDGKTMTLTQKRIVKITTEGDWKPNHAVVRGLSPEALGALPDARPRMNP